MKEEQLYRLSVAGQRDSKHASVSGQEVAAGDLLKGTASVAGLQFVNVTGGKGGRAYDFLETEIVALKLISENAKRVFEKEGMTGWATEAVDFREKNGEVIPGYSLLSIVGRCGPLNASEAEERVVQRPVGEFKKRFGYTIDPSTLDGNDFMLPQGSYMIVVTERAKSMIELAGLTNVECTPLEDVEVINLTS